MARDVDKVVNSSRYGIVVTLEIIKFTFTVSHRDWFHIPTANLIPPTAHGNGFERVKSPNKFITSLILRME